MAAPLSRPPASGRPPGGSWERLLTALDPATARTAALLAARRHLSIRELAEGTGYDDAVVLHLLREVLNPAAIRLTGRPAATFHLRRLDPVTGRVVTFHWWYEGPPPTPALPWPWRDEGGA
ncbi:MAG: hypothetical protein IRY95_01565, partial [Clostridia bacterium]|nr:hypothetical protein [Clostridia bacterium]